MACFQHKQSDRLSFEHDHTYKCTHFFKATKTINESLIFLEPSPQTRSKLSVRTAVEVDVSSTCAAHHLHESHLGISAFPKPPPMG